MFHVKQVDVGDAAVPAEVAATAFGRVPVDGLDRGPFPPTLSPPPFPSPTLSLPHPFPPPPLLSEDGVRPGGTGIRFYVTPTSVTVARSTAPGSSVAGCRFVGAYARPVLSRTIPELTGCVP